MGGASIWHWIIILIAFGLPVILKLCGVGAKRVMLKSPVTGQLKQGFYGFSWTYLYFGFWVPLIRGELVVAVLHLVLSVVTFGLWQIVVSFLYNKQYTNRLLEKGFRLTDTPERNQRAAAALGVDLSVHAARAA
ncbi:hypothetical protein [Microvirga terricola]|nr:hypothetical protein [Microvirga terricola]